MQTRMVISCCSFLRSGSCQVILKRDVLKAGTGAGRTGLRTFSQTKPKLKEEKSPANILQNWVKSVVSGGTSSSSSSSTTTSAEGVVEDPREFFKRSDGKQIDHTVKRSSSSSEAVVSISKNRKRSSNRMYPHNPKDDKIVWVDCEMTSLETDGQLMEIGVIVTRGNLEEVARLDPIVFKIEESVLDRMNDWCKEHHGKSGLTDSCRKSNVTHAEADEKLLAFLEKHTTARECPIAGNSIGTDRVFIAKQLPKVTAHLHYRSIDVSSIKELTRRWYPALMEAAPKKRWSHRVLDDIEDSIAELKYYRSAVFVDPKTVKAPQPDNVQKTRVKNTAV